MHRDPSSNLAEADLALLHALQVSPRMSWSDASGVLGSTPAALAARWARLRGRGLAWVTAHPGGTYRHLTLALVEVDCTPGDRARVVSAVCADPRVVTVEESTRGRDLLLTVMVADLAALSDLVLRDLEQLPGVARQRTYVATAVHRHGSHWRLDALDPGQVAALERLDPPRRDVDLPAGSEPLVARLAQDGRRSAAELARLTGRNPATVRRQLARVLASDRLSLRCELAAEVSGWSVSSTWTAHAEPADLDRTVQALTTLPELRMCLSTTGDVNLIMTLWTRDTSSIAHIERVVGERLPWLSMREVSINLRTPKRMGWMLDPAGRATGEVVAPSLSAP